MVWHSEGFIGDFCVVHYCKSERRRRILLSRLKVELVNASYVRQTDEAVRSLFGAVSNDHGGQEEEGQAGSVPGTTVLECMSNIIAFMISIVNTAMYWPTRHSKTRT